MGGPGSGSLGGARARKCVSSCFTIGIRKPLSKRYSLTSGWLQWPRSSFGVAYKLAGKEGAHAVALCYEWGVARVQWVALISTVPHYGGRRWWFLCPRCHKRAGRLHLHARASGFACRACHNLTYESAQTSRSFLREHFLRHARACGVSYAYMRDHLRRRMGVDVHETRFIEAPS